MKENSLRDLKAIPKQVFQDCFKSWKKRWGGVFVVEGSTLRVIGAINT
jgi:hypothetical protein